MLGRTWLFNAIVKASIVNSGIAVLEADASPAETMAAMAAPVFFSTPRRMQPRQQSINSRSRVLPSKSLNAEERWVAERVGFVPGERVHINDLRPFSIAEIARNAQSLSIRYKAGTARCVCVSDRWNYLGRVRRTPIIARRGSTYTLGRPKF
jgi:hypothetical protein